MAARSRLWAVRRAGASVPPRRAFAVGRAAGERALRRGGGVGMVNGEAWRRVLPGLHLGRGLERAGEPPHRVPRCASCPWLASSHFALSLASNVLRLSTIMLQLDGADWPFSQPPYVYLKPGIVAQIVPCGIEAAHPVQCAGSRRAPLSAEFVQNAPHSPTPKVHSPLPSPTQTVSMAASCLRRTPRPPLGYSWARRSLAC